MDCHDFDKSKSRNDDKNAASKKVDSSSNALSPSLRALTQDKARQSINKTPKASRDLPIHFHLLADSLSPSTLSHLRTLESHLDTIYPTQIHIHSLNQAEFKALNPWGEAGANWCAYFRLKLGSVLPQELTKALYLDVDTLILRDIRELFAYDLGECAIGAVRSGLSGDSIKIVREHKIHAQNYFNSGVLLINLPKWRTKDLALIHTKEYAEYADQDFLNLIFRDSVCFLPYHYNLQWLAQSRIHFDSSPPHTDTNGIASYPSAIDFSEFASALINPSIVHLLGGYKPWEKSNFQSNPAKPPIFAQNPYHKLWWAIARESPFARQIHLAYYKRTALITIAAYLRAYAPWAYAGLRPFVRVLKLLKSALSSPNPQRTHNAK